MHCVHKYKQNLQTRRKGAAHSNWQIFFSSDVLVNSSFIQINGHSSRYTNWQGNSLQLRPIFVIGYYMSSIQYWSFILRIFLAQYSRNIYSQLNSYSKMSHIRHINCLYTLYLSHNIILNDIGRSRGVCLQNWLNERLECNFLGGHWTREALVASLRIKLT